MTNNRPMNKIAVISASNADAFGAMVDLRRILVTYLGRNCTNQNFEYQVRIEGMEIAVYAQTPEHPLANYLLDFERQQIRVNSRLQKLDVRLEFCGDYVGKKESTKESDVDGVLADYFDLKDKYEELSRTYSQLEKSFEKLQQSPGSGLDERLAAMTQEINVARSQRGTALAQLSDANGRLERLARERQQLDEGYKSLQREANELKSRVDWLRMVLSRTETERDSLGAQQESYKLAVNELAQQLSDANSRYEILSRNFADVERAHSQMASRALNDTASVDSLTETLQANRNAYLAAQDGLVLSALKQVSEQLENRQFYADNAQAEMLAEQNISFLRFFSRKTSRIAQKPYEEIKTLEVPIYLARSGSSIDIILPVLVNPVGVVSAELKSALFGYAIRLMSEPEVQPTFAPRNSFTALTLNGKIDYSSVKRDLELLFANVAERAMLKIYVIERDSFLTLI